MPSIISAGTTAGTAISVSGDTTGNLAFQTNGTTTAMTIDTSQNVGIGTTTPGTKLAIAGAASFVANISAPVIDAGIYRPADGALGFITNGAERMRILSSGDVGIGTADPGGRRCYVADSDNDTCFGVLNQNASVTIPIDQVIATRGQTSAFNFTVMYTSSGLDAEFAFRGDGNGYADGTWNNNGADYAEYFESVTGQAIPVGSTVVLENNKVRLATESDNPSDVIGVVRPKEPSKASMVVGNTAWNKWSNKYLTDDFDRYIMEDHDVLEWTDEEGKLRSYESHNIPSDVVVPADAIRKTHDDKGNKFQHYKLNPAWDPNVEYVNRENRDEWLIIGLVGQVKVLKGQTMGDRWKKMRDVSASVEEWFIR